MSDICGNCGEKVPGGAQFCPHCGAWQIRDQEPRASAAEAADPTTEWSWCEIEWVRSFRGSEFQARPLSPGSEQKLTRSPAFRWRRAEPPPETDAEAREAHEALVSLLVAADWEPIGGAGPWYAERFRRPATVQRSLVPGDRPALPEVPAKPPAIPDRTALPKPSPANAPTVTRASVEPPATPGVTVERMKTAFPARLGIAVLTLISIAIIVFVVLVALGFFRGKSTRPKAAAMATPLAWAAVRPWA